MRSIRQAVWLLLLTGGAAAAEAAGPQDRNLLGTSTHTEGPAAMAGMGRHLYPGLLGPAPATITFVLGCIVLGSLVVLALLRIRAGRTEYRRLLWWAACGLLLSDMRFWPARYLPMPSPQFLVAMGADLLLYSVWIVYGLWKVALPLWRESKQREGR